MTQVALGDNWSRVSSELEAEERKLEFYDKVLVPLLGEVTGTKVLDFGCGPGMLAKTIQNKAGLVFGYDIDPEMVRLTATMLGENNVYSDILDIPLSHFDSVVCNLVLCIVSEAEARRILRNIHSVMAVNGRAFVGFCNPRLYKTNESQLDIRYPSGNAYSESHSYKKTKKEGGYEIIERHRPLEWYVLEFLKAGLKVEKTVFTPEYELNGNNIQDFVIFELSKLQ